MLCSICKKNKKPLNEWVIQEHAMDNSLMREFKVCDECGIALVRKIIKEINPKADEEGDINLMRTGIIDRIMLLKKGNFRIVIKMDLAKARKIVLDATDS